MRWVLVLGCLPEAGPARVCALLLVFHACLLVALALECVCCMPAGFRVTRDAGQRLPAGGEGQAGAPRLDKHPLRQRSPQPHCHTPARDSTPPLPAIPIAAAAGHGLLPVRLICWRQPAGQFACADCSRTLNPCKKLL